MSARLSQTGVRPRRGSRALDTDVTEDFPQDDDASLGSPEKSKIVYLYAAAGQSAELSRIAEEAIWSNIVASNILYSENVRRGSKKKSWGDGQVKQQVAAKDEWEFRLLRLPDDPMDVDGDALNGFMYPSAPTGLLVRRNSKAKRSLSEILQFTMSYSERQALKILKLRGCAISKKDIKRLQRRGSRPSQIIRSKLVCVCVSEDCIPAFVDAVLDHNDGRQIEKSAMQDGLRRPCEKECSCPIAVYLKRTLEIVAAAVSIQAAWRSSKVRKNLAPSLPRRIVEGRASLCIQRWWRMKLWCSRRTFLVKLAKLWDKLGIQLGPGALGMSIKLPVLAFTRIVKYFRRPPALSLLSATLAVCFDECQRLRMCRETMPVDAYFPLFPSWMDIHLPFCSGHATSLNGDSSDWDDSRCKTGSSMSRERKAVIVRLLRNLFYQSVTTLPMAGTSAPRKDNQEVDALMFKGTHTRSSLIQDNQGSVAELLFKLQTASAKELLFYNTWDPYAELEAVFTLGREQARAYVFMLFLLTWDPQDSEGAEILLSLHRVDTPVIEKEKVFFVHGEETAVSNSCATTIMRNHDQDKDYSGHECSNLTMSSGFTNDTYEFDDGLTAWRELVAGVRRLSRAQKGAWQVRARESTRLAKERRKFGLAVSADYEKSRIQAAAGGTRDKQSSLMAGIRHKDELRKLECINKVHARQQEVFRYKKRTRLVLSAMKNFVGKVNKLSKVLEKHGHRVSRELVERHNRALVQASRKH